MDAFAVQRLCGFHPGFAESRVRVNRAAQFRRGQFSANGGGSLGNEFRRVRADDGGAEQLVGRGIGNPFHEANVLSRGDALAESGEPERAGLHGAVLLLRVVFAQAGSADFRRRENHVRDNPVVLVQLRLNGVFGGGDALRGGVMRELDFVVTSPMAKMFATFVRQ